MTKIATLFFIENYHYNLSIIFFLLVFNNFLRVRKVLKDTVRPTIDEWSYHFKRFNEFTFILLENNIIYILRPHLIA